MAANDYFEAKIKGYLAADPYELVVHYKLTTLGAAANESDQTRDFVLAIISQLMPKILPVQAVSAHWNGVRGVIVNNPEQPVHQAAIAMDGTGETYALPVEDAVLFTLRCDLGGRKRVGHKYVPGISRGLAKNDDVDVADANIVALSDQLKNTINENGSTWTPVIWHPTDNGGDIVTRAQTNGHVSHQRRRKPRF